MPPREKPRTADEIDAELDAWLEHRAETTTTLSGLRESLQSLQALYPKDGTFPLPAELTTKLERLETQLTAQEAELTAANGTIRQLQSELGGLRDRKPAAGPPPPTPQNDPPAPRKTRTGVDFL